MKVQIKFTLDIDVNAWILNYGTEKFEIREDVKRHVIEGVLQHLDDLELLTETHTAIKI